MTGFAGTDGPIGGKWPVLKETVPSLTHVKMILHPETPIHQGFGARPRRRGRAWASRSRRAASTLRRKSSARSRRSRMACGATTIPQFSLSPHAPTDALTEKVQLGRVPRATHATGIKMEMLIQAIRQSLTKLGVLTWERRCRMHGWGAEIRGPEGRAQRGAIPPRRSLPRWGQRENSRSDGADEVAC